MADEIDLHLGRRLRRRRRLLGLTQQQLAAAIGIRFQQIQKYECGANRISAARLWQLSQALQTPISYFYDGLSGTKRDELASADEAAGRGEVMARKETMDLIRAYYQLGERPRRRLLDLAKSLNAGASVGGGLAGSTETARPATPGHEPNPRHSRDA
jgi:transcriptional regulator with XRE-family HTH domain